MASTSRSARAVLTHSVIDEIDRLPQARRIFAEAGEERVARMRQLLPIAWVDLDEHLRLVEALYAAVGPDQNRAFWRRVMVTTLSTPLVAGVVRMSTAGHGPMRLLARGQLVHGALTRGTGTLAVVDPTESSCVITLSGFPSSAHSLDCYANGIGGSILGACDRAGVRPRVVTTLVSEARGDARYDVSWEA